MIFWSSGDTPESTKSGFPASPGTSSGTGPGTLVLVLRITCGQPPGTGPGTGPGIQVLLGHFLRYVGSNRTLPVLVPPQTAPDTCFLQCRCFRTGTRVSGPDRVPSACDRSRAPTALFLGPLQLDVTWAQTGPCGN